MRLLSGSSKGGGQSQEAHMKGNILQGLPGNSETYCMSPLPHADLKVIVGPMVLICVSHTAWCPDESQVGPTVGQDPPT